MSDIKNPTYSDTILQALAEAEVNRDNAHAALFEAETLHEGKMAQRRMFHRMEANKASVQIKEQVVKDAVLMESIKYGTEAFEAQSRLACAKVAKDRADSLFWQAKRTVDIYMGGK